MNTVITFHKAEKYAVDMRSLTEEVRTFFMRNFGCARKVYNLYVDALYAFLEKNGYAGGAPVEGFAIPPERTFKTLFPYLKEADSLGLMNARVSFSKALDAYNERYDHTSHTKRALRRDSSGTEPLSFRGLKGMPKFHSKAHGDFSYTTNCQYPKEGSSLKNPTVRLEKDVLFLPKLKEGVRLVLHRPLPEGAVIGSVTMSMDTDGRLYASVEYAYAVEMDMTLREAAIAGTVPEGTSFLGLDYSQKDFYVNSEGRKANYPHFYRETEGRLAFLQHELSRMVKGSNNYSLKLAQIQRLSIKIRNQRRDFLCKEASYLASRYDVIGVEDIDLRAMGQALSLGKNLHDNGFGMFRERLARKLEEKGSVLVKVSRSFASTKTCHVCGYKNDSLTLSDREWACPACGTRHDRDENAAINIREEARRIFAAYFAKWLADDASSRKRAEALSTGRRKKKAA